MLAGRSSIRKKRSVTIIDIRVAFAHASDERIIAQPSHTHEHIGNSGQQSLITEQHHESDVVHGKAGTGGSRRASLVQSDIIAYLKQQLEKNYVRSQEFEEECMAKGGEPKIKDAIHVDGEQTEAAQAVRKRVLQIQVQKLKYIEMVYFFPEIKRVQLAM